MSHAVMHHVGKDGVGLCCIDFAPDFLRDDHKHDHGNFAKFSTLLHRVNSHLRDNPFFSVKFCETVQFRVDGSGLKKPDKSDFQQFGEGREPLINDKFVKGLRVWLTRLPAVNPEKSHYYPDEIGYLNFAPTFDAHGLPEPVLEGGLFNALNHHLEQHPLPGKIITVESLEFRGLTRSKFDPDLTSWDREIRLDETSKTLPFISALRLWYLKGQPQLETVKFKDFYPAILRSPRDDMDRAELQSFPAVLLAVEEWMGLLPSTCSIIGINTLTARAEEDGQLSAPAVTFHVDILYHRCYVKFLRVVYVEQSPVTSRPPAYKGPRLTTQLFLPEETASGGLLTSSCYEPVSAVKTHVDNWAQQNAARVLGVETVWSKVKSGGEYRDGHFNPDCMFTWHGMAEISRYIRLNPTWERYLIGFRLFLENH